MLLLHPMQAEEEGKGMLKLTVQPLQSLPGLLRRQGPPSGSSSSLADPAPATTVMEVWV